MGERPSATAIPCRHCDGTGWSDPIGDLARDNAAEAAFLAAYPRMTCPSCRKRMSPRFDNIDARDAEVDPVRMSCHRCGHGFVVPRGG